jgi:hypothetical protein
MTAATLLQTFRRKVLTDQSGRPRAIARPESERAPEYLLGIDSYATYAEIGVRKYPAAMPLITWLSNSARVERGYSSIMISDSA